MTDAAIARLRVRAEDDYLVYVETYAETPGVSVVTGDVRYRISAFDHEYLSAVFGARLDPATADRRIGEIVEVLGRDGRPFIWTIWPSDTPADLAERLVAAGFEDLGSDPLMTLDLSAAPDVGIPPAELDVRAAVEPDEVADASAFAVGSLGDIGESADPFMATFQRLALEPGPRLRLFTGSIDGTIVSASALFTGAGNAGIYAVATSDESRGRGYGRAVTAAAIEAGRTLGLDLAVLMASELGQPVYRRLGFLEVGRVGFLRWPGAAGTSRAP